MNVFFQTTNYSRYIHSTFCLMNNKVNDIMPWQVVYCTEAGTMAANFTADIFTFILCMKIVVS